MKISQRAQNLGTETAFEVALEVEKLIQQGKDIIPFHIGQPDFKTPQNICQAAIRSIQAGHHGYTPSPGLQQLREIIAHHLSLTRRLSVTPESVVVDCGAKPFIAHVISTLTDSHQNDEIIFPCPGYPIYSSLIKDNGALPVPLWLNEDGTFALEKLEKKISSKTRLLILNSPHNPTGSLLDKNSLQKIAEIVLKHDNLWVFSDEPYSGLVYNGEFQSLASFPGMQERTIIVDCLSKRYAMPGWRLGFASNPLLASYLSRRITNNNSCAAHITQYAAIEALSGPQEEAENMFHEFKRRRDLIVRLLNNIQGIRCPSPGGAFYVWPNVEEVCHNLNLKNSEELRKKLLYEANVSLLSDKHFLPEGTLSYPGEHLRLSFTTSFENIKKGLQRIKDCIESKI